MLLDRSRLLVGSIVAAVIVVGTIWAVGLSAGAFVPGDEVEVELADASGLEAGDPVLVAGVRTGQVTSVGIEGDRVLVRLRTTAELPHDSGATVANRNALGARALRLEVGRDWDQLLTELDEPRIPLERTRVVIDIPELGDETVALLEGADVDALTELVVSLADVTEDRGEDLDELLDGLQRVGDVVADRRDELATFLATSGELVATLNEADTELLRAIDGVGAVVADLNARRSDLVRLVESTGALTTTATDLLVEERDRIDRSLSELGRILAMVDRHQVDLAHTIGYGGVAFEGFSGIGYSGAADNPYWGNVLASSVGPVGTESTGGCGGLIDQVLDQLLGPGPPCTPDESSRVGPNDGSSRDVLGTREAEDADGPPTGRGVLGSLQRFLQLGGDS